MTFETGRLYIDLLKRLQARQIAGRARRVIPPILRAAGMPASRDCRLRPVAAGLGVDPAPQSGPDISPAASGGEFRAFGAARTFGTSGFWRNPKDGLLLLFHLHGFSPLAHYAAGSRSLGGDVFWAQVIESWLTEESRPRHPGWHPYPTSVRIISWSAAISTVTGWSSELRSRIGTQLSRQARYLERSIEYDIGGNHVLKNATALVYAGAVTGSTRLLTGGLGLLQRQLSQQLHHDGGHFELSPSYHRVMRHDLEDVRTLLVRLGQSCPSWLEDAILAAKRWETQLRGPDGGLPMLNDGWEGPREPGGTDRMVNLPDSGYTVLRHERDQLVFDAGSVSPGHLPAHAHADALSFVLWADGEPVLVDPGSYLYSGEWRRYFRSTSAHNTVEVDGTDQCELWGDFRLAYPPRVTALEPLSVGGATVLSAWHDGYRRLADPVEHHRNVVWLPGQGVVIVDLLRARKSHRIRSFLHLAPHIALRGTQDVGPFALAVLGCGAVVTRPVGRYSAYLGQMEEAPVVQASRDASPETPFGWSLLRGERRVSYLDRQEVVLEGGTAPPTVIPLRWG